MRPGRGLGRPRRNDARVERIWERIYEQRTRPSTGLPNPILRALACSLTRGTALDLGCALGDDSLWLASRGWRVTAVDVSATALARTSTRAAQLDLTKYVDFQRHDLADSFPAGEFDLVYALYLQSTSTASERCNEPQSVAPGGRLPLVTHGSRQPWSWSQDPDPKFPTPEQQLNTLRLDPDEWIVGVNDTPQRKATGPEGQEAIVTDIVTRRRRRTAATPTASEAARGLTRA